MRRRFVVSVALFAAAAGGVVLAPASVAQVSVGQSQVVAAVPTKSTPALDGGVVRALSQVGSWIVAGGSFTRATAPGTSTSTPVRGLVAFDQSSGALDTAFMPRLDGNVDAVLPGPTAGTVYVGGTFATVNGVTSKHLALLKLSTGGVVSGFKVPALNGTTVFGMRMTAGQLLLAGTFTTVAGQTREIGFFPLSGGYTPAATAVARLPANVYEAGPWVAGTYADTLSYRSWSAANTIGPRTVVATSGIAWGSTRGAFVVGSTLFYGDTSGNFYRASFDGTAVGTPTPVDPYDDPYWDSVPTGSGQTYQGVKSGYYSELPNVTGAFYSDGRLYYTLAGQSALCYRYFTPDSGTIGGTQFTAAGGTFTGTAGMFLSRHTLYVAHAYDGTLHALTFTNGGTNGQHPTVSGPNTVVSGPNIDGNDWRATSLFPYTQPTTAN